MLLNPLLYLFGIIVSFLNPYNLVFTIILSAFIILGVRASKRSNPLHAVAALLTATVWRTIHLALYLATYTRLTNPNDSLYTWAIGNGMPSIARAGWPSPLMLPPGAGGNDTIPFGQLLWAYHNEMAALLISILIVALTLTWLLPKKTSQKLAASKPFIATTITLAILAHLAFNGLTMLWFD